MKTSLPLLLSFSLLGLALSACAQSDPLDGTTGGDGGATTSGSRPPENGGGGGGIIAGTGGDTGCTPTAEVCDGVDNDCNGQIDEGCDCTPGATEPCFTADVALVGVGTCAEGTATCDATGKWGVDCVGEVLPVTETCDGTDEDCDGVIDNGFETITCGKGVCQVTVDECANGVLQTCTPLMPPDPTEDCDGVDDDCDGMIDEGCLCTNGQTQPCYTGPMGTTGIGPCKGGTQTCVGGQWGACTGEVTPVAETCDSIDQDCDGNVAEGTCNLANASSTCSSGGCSITSCASGYDNCDSNMANGCEKQHTGATNSAPGEYLGSFDADSVYGFGCTSGGSCEGPIATRTGTQGRFFNIDGLESSSCCAYSALRFELVVPAGADYDLYLGGTGCFADPDWSSTKGTGQTETITIFCDDDCGGADNSFTVNGEVRFYGGSSCQPWTLNVYRRNC